MHVLRRIRARDPAEDIHGRISVSFPPRPCRDHHGRARGTRNLRQLFTINYYVPIVSNIKGQYRIFSIINILNKDNTYLLFGNTCIQVRISKQPDFEVGSANFTGQVHILRGICRHFTEQKMVKKAGICWHFKTVQTHIRLTVETDTSFFPVFQANLLNENDILAIIAGKIWKHRRKQRDI